MLGSAGSHGVFLEGDVLWRRPFHVQSASAIRAFIAPCGGSLPGGARADAGIRKRSHGYAQCSASPMKTRLTFLTVLAGASVLAAFPSHAQVNQNPPLFPQNPALGNPPPPTNLGRTNIFTGSNVTAGFTNRFSSVTNRFSSVTNAFPPAFPPGANVPREIPTLPGTPPNAPGVPPQIPVTPPGLPGDQPGLPGNQPGLPGNQPGLPGNQPGLPGNPPGLPGDQPGLPGNPGGAPPPGSVTVPGPGPVTPVAPPPPPAQPPRVPLQPRR